MTAREQKALVLADSGRIQQHRNLWLVPASKHGKKYTVDPVSGHCTCPDHQLRQVRCKHLLAVDFTISRRVTVTQELRPDGTVAVTKTETTTKAARVTYRQNWSAYNAAQTEEKHRFAEMLNELCTWVPDPPYKTGRPRLPMADMAFASVYKVYSGFSARRFTCDLADMQADGMVSRAGHFNSVNRYLANPALTPIFRDLITMSSLPMKAIEQDFAVDSSGFTTCRFVRWYDKRWGRNVETDQHEWLKVHLMCGVQTHIVTAVEIAGWDQGNDAPYLAPIVEHTAENFEIRYVSADKGYASHKNPAVIEVWGRPRSFRSSRTRRFQNQARIQHGPGCTTCTPTSVSGS